MDAFDLEERTCVAKKCGRKFKVSKHHAQEYHSEFCKETDHDKKRKRRDPMREEIKRGHEINWRKDD